jgi:hypothetical protein
VQRGRMRCVRGYVALLCVVLVEASSVADECGVLGAPSFRLGDGGDGCVVCVTADGSPCPTTEPASTPESESTPETEPTADHQAGTADTSVCYGQAAHPYNMALNGDEDIEQHRIPECSCHASCAKCGYADMPTEETKCIGAPCNHHVSRAARNTKDLPVPPSLLVLLLLLLLLLVLLLLLLLRRLLLLLRRQTHWLIVCE